MNQYKSYIELLNLNNLGGENLLDNSIVSKFNVEHDSFYEGKVEAFIKPHSFSKDQVLEPGCLEPFCTETTQGVWTTAIQTPFSKVLSNITYYWIDGALDNNGNAWVADVGFLTPLDFSTYIVDANIPLTSQGTFSSYSSIPKGLKFASIKKVSKYSIIPIQNIIGNSNKTLPRSTKGYLLNYIARDQKVPLDQLSIGLLSLIDETYQDPNPCLQTFGLDPLDFKVGKLLKESTEILFTLLEPTPTKRSGAIIHNLNTYSTPQSLYGFQAEALYLNPQVVPLDNNCIQDCVGTKELHTLATREIENLSICWFVIYAWEYSKATQNNLYKTQLSTIGSYLIDQIDTNGFMYKGWTDANPITQSEQVTSTSLEINVIALASLLKLFELTSDPTFLDKALQIKDYIFSNYYSSKSKLFRGETSTEPTVKSCLYGLILSALLNRLDIAESIYNYLFPKVTNPITITNSPVTNLGLVVTSEGQEVSESEYLKANSIFYLSPNENYTDIELETLNHLYIETFNYLQDYLPHQPLLNTVSQFVLSNKASCTMFGISSSLRSSNIISRVISNQLRYLNAFEFNRLNLTDLAYSFYPTEYSWASKKALSSQGNLGKLIQSITRPLSLNYVLTLKHINNSTLNKATGYDLDTLIENEYSTSRRLRESDKDLKDRIKSNLSKSLVKSTLPSLTQRLQQLNINPLIKERYKTLCSFNDLYNEAASLSNSYLQGREHTYKTIDIEIDRPTDKDSFEEISSCMPISTKYHLTQSIALSPCSQSSSTLSNYLDITQVINGSGFILTEDSNGYVLDENGCPIFLEQTLID